MSELRDHIRQTAVQALNAIEPDERIGIYAVSFFVQDEDDDPRVPTVTVGFNTEDDVAAEMSRFSTSAQEARWNYASWRQNELELICQPAADPVGAELLQKWTQQLGLRYELTNGEGASFHPRGEPLTRAFIELLVEVVQVLHREGEIERIFGRRIPVLIHELEYYDAIADQNVTANSPELIPDDFIRWCRGDWD